LDPPLLAAARVRALPWRRRGWAWLRIVTAHETGGWCGSARGAWPWIGGDECRDSDDERTLSVTSEERSRARSDRPPEPGRGARARLVL